jgi:hypothetical protein
LCSSSEGYNQQERTMATLTKVELVQINARLATENAALREQVAQLTADLQRSANLIASAAQRAVEEDALVEGQVAFLKAELAQAKADLQRSASRQVPSRPARTPYEMPQWQIDRAATMAAAKALAVHSGRTVKA